MGVTSLLQVDTISPKTTFNVQKTQTFFRLKYIPIDFFSTFVIDLSIMVKNKEIWMSSFAILLLFENSP